MNLANEAFICLMDLCLHNKILNKRQSDVANKMLEVAIKALDF